MTQVATKPKLMTEKKAAQYTGIPYKTLQQRRREGKVPHVRIDGSVYYRPERLDAWFDEIEFIPPSDAN